MWKKCLILEFEFLPCQFQVGTSVTWIILFWCCCLIYKLKLICLVVKLLSVINKCSRFCYYHYFHIYFVICYLGDERVQIVNRGACSEPSEQVGQDEVGSVLLWNEALVHTAVCARLLLYLPFPPHLTHEGVEVPKEMACHWTLKLNSQEPMQWIQCSLS